MGMRGLFLRKKKMFKTIHDGKLPTRATKYSACVDLYAREDVTIGAGETKLIPLGVCIDTQQVKYMGLDQNYGIYDDICDSEKIEHFLSSHYLQLMLRSSLSKHLVIANGVGVIDLDYKDEIMIRVHNPLMFSERLVSENLVAREVNETTSYHIKKGDRVAQITLLEHKSYLFGIDTKDERTGGFGSTGE